MNDIFDKITFWSTFVMIGILIICVLLGGCVTNEQITNPNQPQNEIRFEDLKTATCDELSNSYTICKRGFNSVYKDNECNTRYIPLIAERCKN